MIPQETVERILSLAKVEEVIGDFVTLKRQGANYLACCPFHNEKTPSFSVSPVKGFYYCFGCKKGGSAITFLMEHEAMSYNEALRFLAKKYGVEIQEKEETAEDLAARQRKESLYIVSEFAQKYFAGNLAEGEGRAVGYQYFKKRGLEDATIEKFGLGWCPSDSKAFYKAAIAAGYKEEYLVETGLCVKKDNGDIYDRFHERVVFPLHSVSGRVIGFSCRTLKSDKTVAKYVNSPQTDIYDKSKFLYGIWFAKQQIAKENNCILVEGNLDMVSLHQLGLTNVVASCGTSLTVDQIRLIKRFTDNVTIIYDGDAAGIHAAIRGIGLVLKEGLNVKIVLLPDGQDPDDFTKSHTLEQVKEFIAKESKDFIAFKADMMLADAGDDPLKKAELINDLADTVALIPDPVKRAVYSDSCSAKFEISKNIFTKRVNATFEAEAEETRKRRERERREEASAVPVETETINLPGAEGKRVKRPAASKLEPIENNLLDFLLNYGLETLSFATDSEYYMDPLPTVAEFIDCSLEADNVQFEEGPRRKIYELYFKYYDEGLDKDEILRRILASGDADVISKTVELTARQDAPKYEVTEKYLKSSMTKQSTILIHEVPKTILLYHVKRIEQQIDSCKKRVSTNPESMNDILREIGKLNEARVKLNKKLGRI